ncbi:MFS transporter [Colwellia sp. Bg11-28]|uniref:MFS transporter n=1 Tax=Colwellia sp. Bg11-28 TaxID=2058305 RepID=UPI000C34E3BF|nr:MFS transporter [Colwellia sp. Bg11-28]PKH87148.1 MFS transporter [Colwellia sp. Bg11-28]
MIPFNMMFVRLSSSYFFYFALLGLISPYLAIFLDGQGFNSRQVGEILAIMTATKIVAPSLWATFADKSARPLFIIRLGALLALVSFSLLYWFSQYWPITFCLALFTLFWTAILPQLEVHTLNSTKHSSKIYARIRLWGSLGFIVLAVVAGEAISRLGYQVFTSLGVIILAGLFISTLLLTPKKGVELNKGKANAPEPIVNKLIDGRFISFFIAGLLLQISFAPYYGFFALFLRDFDYSGVAVGLFIALGAVAEIVAFIYMGSLFKRFSLNSLLVFSLAITALRWFLMPVVADSGLWLAINQLSHAASFAIYHSASMKFISSHFTKSQQSRGQGVYLGGVYGVGGAVGAYITGLLWLGGEGASNAFIMAGISALLGAIIMIFSKK